jgi:broad specificity phosphatase PhoE
VSPRVRAVATSELLFGRDVGGLKEAGKVEITEALAEWGYGDYEGLKDHEIRALRKERGLDKERPWDIWIDGCENGECVNFSL